MKYKITVERIPHVNEEEFKMALSCIVSSLYLISLEARGEIINNCQFIIDIELENCGEVKDSMKIIFGDAINELRFKDIEKYIEA